MIKEEAITQTPAGQDVVPVALERSSDIFYEDYFSLTDTGSPYIVCAFYTDKYAADVLNLKESLDRFQIPYYIKYFKSRGYWEANTRIKPEYILSCLYEFEGRDILYLDADSVVRSPLNFFNNFEEDIGVFVSPDIKQYSHKFLTGTLYLKNKPAVISFVKEWIKQQDNSILQVDQDSFQNAVDKNKDISIGELPSSYTKIYDRGDETPVIEHFQSSRRRTKLQKVIKRVRNCAIFIILGLFIYVGLGFAFT